MSSQKIILVGAGGHARSCIDTIEQTERFAVYGLVGTATDIGSESLGYPVVGTDEALEALRKECKYALVTVGQIKTPDLRIELFTKLRDLGFSAPSVISPRATVSKNASIGPGSIVMHGAIVNAGATIGANCIVNSMSLVEHDAVVSNHCHISTGAIVNGGVRVGEGSFLGSRCVVKESVRIGRRCVVGMGAIVRSDCADDARIVQD